MALTTVLFDVSNITRDGNPNSFPLIGLGCSHGNRCPRQCGVVGRLLAVEGAARRAFGSDALFRYVADNSLRSILDDLGPLQRHYRDGCLTWTGEADDVLLADAVALQAKIITKDNFHSKRNIDAHPWIQGNADTFFGWKVLAGEEPGKNVKLVRRAMQRIDTVSWERAAKRDEMKASGLRANPDLARQARDRAYRCITPDCVNGRQGEPVSPVPGAGQRLVCPLCRRPVEEINRDADPPAGSTAPGATGPGATGPGATASPGPGTEASGSQPARAPLDDALTEDETVSDVPPVSWPSPGAVTATDNRPMPGTDDPRTGPGGPGGGPHSRPGRGTPAPAVLRSAFTSVSQPVLLTIESGGSRREVPLPQGKTLVLGRHPDENRGRERFVDVARDLGSRYDYISTRHVEITLVGPGLAEVVDRSHNGTSLGGKRLTRDEPCEWRFDVPLALSGSLVMVSGGPDTTGRGTGTGTGTGGISGDTTGGGTVLTVRHPDGTVLRLPALGRGERMILGRQPIPVVRVDSEPPLVDVCRGLGDEAAERVSRRHLQVVCGTDGGITVTDTSANGSWLGTRQLTPGIPVPWDGAEPVWLVQDVVALLAEPTRRKAAGSVGSLL